MPFFKLLQNYKGFEWSKDVDLAFQSLKVYLSSPPNLVLIAPGETLYLYITYKPR
jgi:hypothetical protein